MTLKPDLSIKLVFAIATLVLMGPISTSSQTRSATFEAQSTNLRNTASAVRISAIHALGNLNDEEVIFAVPLIAKQLEDKNPSVRIAALKTLGSLGKLAEEAVPKIAHALADSGFTITPLKDRLQFQSVAITAAMAIADLGYNGQKALKNLRTSLKSDDPQLRAEVAKAIGYMGDAAFPAVPSLVEALSDPSAETRFEAAYALGQISPIPKTAISALTKLLDDSGSFTKSLGSGSIVFGSVNVAAAEALLNHNNNYISIIKKHGGNISRFNETRQKLPWIQGQQLRIKTDKTDIRDILSVVLRASQMTGSFRKDIEGYLTFDFTGMPVQGAFNMLIHDYNLAFEWNKQRRHLRIFPHRSVIFRRDFRRPSSSARPQPNDGQSKAILKENKIRLEYNKGKQLIKKTIHIKPNKGAVTAKESPKATKGKTDKNSPQSSIGSPKLDAPHDITASHRLSFIIKYDGLYRAVIDGKEYTAGMDIATVSGNMIIVDIRKNSVHLLQKTAGELKQFVIRRRR